MPVTHDSMRLIEQAKTICEQRIYLDEAKELYSLISSKWLHVSYHYFWWIYFPTIFLQICLYSESIARGFFNRI